MKNQNVAIGTIEKSFGKLGIKVMTFTNSIDDNLSRFDSGVARRLKMRLAKLRDYLPVKVTSNA